MTGRILFAGALGLLAAAWGPACSQGTDQRADAGDADGWIQPDGDEDHGEAGDPDGGAPDAADEGPIVLAVSGVLPSRGPVEGGTWANIIGSAFVRGIGDSPFDVRDVTDVTFNDNSAIDIEVIRDDMISVRTPAGIAGPADVTVENPNGRVTLKNGFTYFETVTAYRVDPEHFSSRGGTGFSVDGTGFTADTTVLVGGRPASSVDLVDSTRVNAVAPPGNPGAADVEVVNRNGRALIFRGVTYHAVPELARVDPAAGPEAGGTSVTATGQGFEPGQEIRFGPVLAQDIVFLAADSLAAVTPAGLPGSIDVSVAGPVDLSVLPGGFVYLPAATGVLTVSGVAPSTGPRDGGQIVTVAGEGFAAGVDQVLFGAAAAPQVVVDSDRMLSVEVPAGTPGAVTVRVHTATEQAWLDNAYRFYQPLDVDGIAPVTGPAEGGTPFTLSGSGFHGGVAVFFAGSEATSVQVLSETELTGVTPPGSPGSADVAVRDDDSSATLPSAFGYTTDLSLLRVDPDYGAMAGGTYVVVYGEGFGAGARIWFGAREGGIIQILSSSVLTARTPRGDPGEVTVRLELGEQSAELPAGFSYIDPTNDRGGASGGPIQGAINVTALDGSYTNYGAPVPGATVLLDEPAISGLTDDRGQVTLSGPSLVKAVNVTVAKEGFEAITVVGLNAANLTVYLFPNETVPIDIQPGDIKLGAIRGRVFGFKNIPGLPSGPTITMQARVNRTAYSIYAVPPYGGVPQGIPVESDGDPYEFGSLRFGNYSVYALFGAYDSESSVFTPALLGVRRDIQVNSEDTVTGQDIVLGTYLDRSVPVHLESPPAAVNGGEVIFGAYVSLDLGQDGVIFLAQDSGTGTDLLLEGLPSAASNAFIFVGLATSDGRYPYSYTFRRQEGDIGQGVELGPFLGFTNILTPRKDDPDDPNEPPPELVDGHIAWQVQQPQPELIQILIETNELIPNVLWRVILPGDATGVTLPQELLGLLPLGEPLILLMYTADSPRFNFDRFNYSQLGSGRWTSYTVNFEVFTAP